MSDILYYIIIYPLQLIIEILFNALYNSEVSIGLTIFSVSLFVNLGSLPMFLSAYKLQKKEKDIQEKMAPKVKSIKANFKGAEKFMMLSTYYKQNKYHPIMSLRISLSLLLEIPFFIAAYLFFSQLDIVNGMSCWFIKDLSLPDKLLTINGLTINILPILMTIFNIISGEIYLKGCKFKEKLQMYVLAIIFLVILYNSPSGLVLYWTFNNLISLVRNLVIKSKKIKFLSFALIFVFAFCLLYKVVINMSQPFMAVGLFCLIFVIPFYVCIKDININKIVEQKSKKSEIGLFVLSVVNIFVLVSLLIPTTIIASDVTAFYNKNYSYFILLFYISIKFFGIFIFWPVITYCFLSKNLKKFLLYFSVNINFIFIVSMFSFFSENLRFYLIYNIFYYILVVSIISFLLYKKYFSILIKIMTIIILTIVILSISNIYKINKSFSNRINSVQKNETKKIHLSKTDKNILVFILDTAIGPYLPLIFKEDKSLEKIYTGFTYYRNTLSHYHSTVLALPPLLGGYEYLPKKINKFKNKNILKKLEEGAFVLPSILQNNNWNVTLFDYEYYSNEYKNDYLIGEFSNLYRQNYMNNNNRDYDVKNIQLQSVNYQVNIFTKYSVIYCMPDFLRVFFINKTKKEQTFLFQLDTFVDNVSALFYLPYITDFNSKKNNFYIFENYVTHHIFEYYLTNPDVVIDFFNENVSALATEYRRKLSKEMGLNSGLQNYCENYIAYSLIGKFLLFLKENDVYDNTRIIIVSDHGDYSNLFYDSEKCPNIDFVDNFYNPITCYYFPVLFVKDFNAKGKYKTDYTLMTNADVPSIVTKDIIDNPINQFTNKKLTTDEKNNGLDLFADLPRCYPKDFQHTVFEKNSRFMYFKGSDIFDENNYMFDYGYEDK